MDYAAGLASICLRVLTGGKAYIHTLYRPSKNISSTALAHRLQSTQQAEPLPPFDVLDIRLELSRQLDCRSMDALIGDASDSGRR